MLRSFLEQIFGKEFLLSESEKFEQYKPKGKLGTLRFLTSVNIHRAAKWYRILWDIAGRGCAFDLNYTSEAEEFIYLMLFAYAFNDLVRLRKANLQDSMLLGKLRNREEFESLMYEVLVASNYASNEFEVHLYPKVDNRTLDVFAHKEGSIKVYVECKRLRREEAYNDLAIEVGSWLIEKGLNLMVDVELIKTPKRNDVERISNAIKEYIEGRGVEHDIRVQYYPLPEYLHNPLSLQVKGPESIEYVLALSYTRFSEKGVEIKEPKVIVFRNINKHNELIAKIDKSLSMAHDQLKFVRDARKVIYIDLTEIIGRQTLLLPELIKLDAGPEILFGKVEEYVRSWLARHADVDAVALTHVKLYTDHMGLPYSVVVENRAVTSYVVPGWTIVTRFIPMPKDSSPEQLTNLGLHFKSLGLYQLSEFYFRKALEERPVLKEAYNNLGNLLRELGRVDEALQYFDKALELDPNYTSALINKGIALAEIWKFDEALKYLKKAIDVNPAEPKAHYNIAVMYAMKGDVNSALYHAKKALTLDPNYEEAANLMNYLRKLKDLSTT
ncbi:MAG: tetratricopeptide repeat protein [Crenarchaeota archaeon]|nr:tetratricopeptide repeat protein [Thermoproteota archaeon]